MKSHNLPSKLILVLVVALFFIPVFSAYAATLSVDGAQKFQTIDGFGVNANSLSWNNGELEPAIDMLADEMGSTLWRVVFDMEDWESTNDNSDPNVFNWDYYNGVYSNSKFQNLWGTIGYLNQKGISSGIMLSLMGRVPGWMDSVNHNGSKLDVAYEDEWVETVASLLYYARNTMHLSFFEIDPLNETDWDGYEGPQVDQYQYARLLNKLSQKMDSIGISDIKIVGPNTASIDTGVTNYMPEMMRDSVVMSKVDNFGFHNYAASADGADQAIKGSPYPDRNFYMTEFSLPFDLLTMIPQGPSGFHVWDGYDSVYNHAIIRGSGSTPPNDAGNGPAPLAYDTTTGTYSPRKCFYQFEQIFKYIPSGSVRIAATQSNGNIVISAYYHQLSGRVTIIGGNSGSGTISYTGTLANLPGMSALRFYWTSNSDPSKNFFRDIDIAVTNGTFAFNAPSNSIFTLTGLVNGADITPPLVSITAPTDGATVSNTTTISSSATDTVGVAAVRFLLNGANLGSEITSPPYNLLWDTRTVANGNYQLSAMARDIGGNTATSPPINVIVSNQDVVPPIVSITSPLQNASVAGTLSVIAAAADNVGVAGVQFLLDGAAFGPEIRTAPYTTFVDTTIISDGTHTVAAIARDTSGNTAASQSVSFNVINNPGTVFPINLVQKASNITSSAQNLATTMPSPVAIGDLIVVSVSGWPNLPASNAVTDSLGNTYSIGGTVLASQGAYSAIYYAKNVRGGTNTVTVNTVSSGGQISMAVAEFSGVDTVSPLDRTAGTVGSGNTPSSGNMTPSSAGDLLVGSGTHNGNTVTTAGTGFTMIAVPTEDSNSHQPLAMEYQVLTGTLQTSATFKLATGYPWTQNGVLFKPAVQQGPDTSPPTVSITSPQNGSTVSAAVMVFATASDNVGVTKVEFYLDAVLQAMSTSSPYVWSWNTLPISNGSHTLTAMAYDAAGNVGQSGTITITVFNDTLAPTVTVSAPDNNTTVSGSVTVTAVAIDNVGVSEVEFYVNGTLQATDTTSPFSFSWNTSTIANGPYILTARAYDAAGNIGSSNIVTVTVANPLAGIALVQKASNITSSAQNLATTMPSPVAIGDLIVVSVSGWPNLPASNAVTDSLGNTYSIGGTVLASQGAYSAIYYAKNVRGGTNTVTVNTVSSGGQISMAVAEFSGVDTVSPLDRTAGTAGSGNTPSSGNMTPSSAGDLLVGSGTHNGNTVTTAGTGFTMIAVPTEDSNSHQPLAMEYQVLTGTPQTTATFNLATGYPWVQNGVLFKPAVQQGSDTVPPSVTAFTIPATANTLTVAISSFIATDNVGVTGYLVTESTATPLATGGGWTAAAPTSYTFTTAGNKTLYAWATDAAGNVSASLSANIIIDTPPTVTAFTIPAIASALTISITTFTATDNIGVTGYLVTESTATPLATGGGWTATAPTSYTFTTAGNKTLYAWAKDAAGNVSASRSASVTITLPDTIPPTVTVFTVPATANTLTVAISSFIATDNVGVTGYLVTESTATPLATGGGWTATAPTSYTFATAGSKTLYAWTKDAAGNVSASLSASTIVTLIDTTPPTVTAFTIPAIASALTISITTFTATDNIGVTGYLVTESTATPLATGGGWTATAPTSYTFTTAGNKTLYAWAKDVAGNVSASRSASVTITLPDTTPPTAPTNLTAIASGPTQVNLNWTASTDNVGVAGYRIMRNGSQIATSSIIGYSDTTVTAGTTYSYIVWAYDAAGNVSPDSNTASVTTPTVSSAPVLDKTVTTKQASGSGSISSPGITTAQPNELLVAFIASDGPTTGGSQRITAVTGGGLTWTLRSRANAQAGTAEIWSAAATNVVTNVIVTATRTTGSYQGMITVAAFQGASLTVNGAAANASAASGAPSVTLTTTKANSLVWAAGDDWDRAVARTVSANQMKQSEYLAPAGDTFWVQYVTAPSTAAGVSTTISCSAPTNDRWNLAAFEILPK